MTFFRYSKMGVFTVRLFVQIPYLTQTALPPHFFPHLFLTYPQASFSSFVFGLATAKYLV